MTYSHIRSGYFLSRPNRFIAWVEIDGRKEKCHVKNTGRCKELLTDRALVYIQESDNPARKTKYDVIAVQKGELLINMDAQAPNRAAEEWLKRGGLLPHPTQVKAEAKFGQSRLDFYLENAQRRMFVEVKGVTLEEHGVAKFPDAPTQRGIKHIQELCRCVEDGYEATLLFVVQMKGMYCVTPNWDTHPEFGQALQEAQRKGVQILAMDCTVTPDSITISREVPFVWSYS